MVVGNFWWKVLGGVMDHCTYATNDTCVLMLKKCTVEERLLDHPSKKVVTFYVFTGREIESSAL